MGQATAARVAWAMWAAAALLWVVCLGLYIGSGLPPIPGGSDGGLPELVVLLIRIAGFLGVSTIGAIVSARQPSNPVGWLILAAALMSVMQVVANRYSAYAATVGEWPILAGGVWLAWVAGCISAASLSLVSACLVLLPSGRLPSPRWRIVLGAGFAFGAIGVLAAAFMPGPLFNTPWITNPIGIAWEVLTQLSALATLGGLVTIVLSAASLPVRLRQAQGDERVQLKWIVFGVCIFVLGYSATVVLPREWAGYVRVAYLLSILAFVAALGVAMLKYHLYSVDVVISRSLLYGGLAVIITATYVGVVVGVGGVIGTHGEPSLMLSLLATAIVAVAFQPARERLEHVANRLVFGQRANPYDVLAGFSRRVAHALSVDDVLPNMAEATARGVGATRSVVRVYVPGGADRVVAWPAGHVGGVERVVPVLHQGQLVGEIGVAKRPGESLTPAEQALLDDLAAQAGAALSNVRLTEDLRASRQRIVAAQDQERRRIERDLHDGAQQHLVALAINARLARELVVSDPSEAAQLLGDVEAQASEALANLRDLARGIYPAALADHGLAAAIGAYLSKVAPNARLEVDPPAVTARFTPEVEAGLYFCCLEALQNTAKHAPAAMANVHLSIAGGDLSFAVTDDGPGFEPSTASAGTGLQGMIDRLAALGGSLDVRSAPGRGTRIGGRIPIQVARAPRIEVDSRVVL